MKSKFHTKENYPHFEWISNGRKKMQGSLYFTLAAFMLLFTQGIQGQMVGWPASSSDNCLTAQTKTINITAPHPNNKYYLDAHRARVTAENPNGANYELDLIDYSSSSTDFDDAEKWCLVIQMIGGDVGVHVLVEIVSISGNTLTVSLPNGNIWPTFDYTGTNRNRVQIIKIETYWDLTLQSGEVTCHEFDHVKGTGGVAPLIVGGGLTINGGWFNVSGKGYMNTADLGSGGPGATALPLNSMPPSTNPVGVGGDLAINSPTGNICHQFAVPPPWNVTPGFQGNSGDDANNPMDPGTSTSSHTTYHPGTVSDYSNGLLRMGQAGDFGMNAGHGGGAGGHGGSGGNTGNNLTFGASGLFGQNGESGGNPNKGGRGGGVMYFKIAGWVTPSDIIDLGGKYKLFYADGGQALSGTHGGDGGIGGEGGDGAEGFCNADLDAAGGWGGFGTSGIGAGGGEGGNAGKPGTIWLIKKSGGSYTPPSYGPYASLRGGKGGGGGSGGYSTIFETNFEPRNYPVPFNTLPCNTFMPKYELCAIPMPCEDVVCDCDEVFKHWGENGSTGFTVDITTNPDLWEIDFTSAQNIYYDAIQKMLYVEKNIYGCNIRYNCEMIKSSTFHTMMKKATTQIDLEKYKPSSGTDLKVGVNVSSYNASSGGFETELFGGSPTHRVFVYEPYIKTLTDVDNVNKIKVTTGNCGEKQRIYFQGLGFLGTEPGLGSLGGPFSIGYYAEIQRILVKDIKTGPDGEDGIDELDGEFDDLFEETEGPMAHQDETTGIEDKEIDFNKNFIVKSVILYSGNIELTMIKQIPDGSICKLYAIDGKLLSSGKIQDSKIQFNYLTSGVYIVKVASEGKTYAQRILITN